MPMPRSTIWIRHPVCRDAVTSTGTSGGEKAVAFSNSSAKRSVRSGTAAAIIVTSQMEPSRTFW